MAASNNDSMVQHLDKKRTHDAIAHDETAFVFWDFDGVLTTRSGSDTFMHLIPWLITKNDRILDITLFKKLCATDRLGTHISPENAIKISQLMRQEAIDLLRAQLNDPTIKVFIMSGNMITVIKTLLTSSHFKAPLSEEELQKITFFTRNDACQYDSSIQNKADYFKTQVPSDTPRYCALIDDEMLLRDKAIYQSESYAKHTLIINVKRNINNLHWSSVARAITERRTGEMVLLDTPTEIFPHSTPNKRVKLSPPSVTLSTDPDTLRANARKQIDSGIQHSNNYKFEQAGLLFSAAKEQLLRIPIASLNDVDWKDIADCFAA